MKDPKFADYRDSPRFWTADRQCYFLDLEVDHGNCWTEGRGELGFYD